MWKQRNPRWASWRRSGTRLPGRPVTARMNTDQWHSPFRALLWKEWRESWWLLGLAVCFPALALPVAESVLGDFELFLWFVPPVCAVLLGARAVASETARGTIHFLGERPVTKAALWTAKTVLPLAALITGSVAFAIPAVSAMREVCGDDAAFVLAVFFMGTLSSFALAMLCSVLVDRPITALAAACVLCFVSALTQHAVITYSMRALQERWPAAAARIDAFMHSAGGFCVLLAVLLVEFLVPLLLSRWIFIRWRRD